MISGRMPWERSFLSLPFGLLVSGMLLQLLLLGATKVAAQEAIITTSSLAPPKPKTTSIIASTTTTIKTSTTPKTTVTSGAATTTHSTSCWSGPSGGAVAGIVISVLILYIVSLMLVAILVSVLTKRGTIDLSNWKLFRMVSTDGKARSSNAELADQNDYTDETHSSPAELYTALETRTRDATPPEQSPYQALQQVGGRKNHRNAKPRIKKKPTTDVTQAIVPQATVPQATDDEIYQNY